MIKNFLPKQYSKDKKFDIKHNYLSEQFKDYNLILNKIKKVIKNNDFTLGTEVNVFENNKLPGINSIKKVLVEISIRSDNTDRFVDFYVVLKRENRQKKIAIDGVLHSTDDLTNFKKYTYHSVCRGSIGLIEYFLIPISKAGTVGELVPLGNYVREDN